MADPTRGAGRPSCSPFSARSSAQIFTNAMLPDLGPRREIGRISGSGWALGYLGGLVSLVVVLALLAPAPGGERTLLGHRAGLRARSRPPASPPAPPARSRALWYWSSPCRSSSGRPTRPPRPAGAGAARRARRPRRDPAALRRHREPLRLSWSPRWSIATRWRRSSPSAASTPRACSAGALFELGVFGIVAAGVGAVGAWIGGRADRAFGPRPVIVASIWVLIAVCAVALMTTRASVLLVPVAAGSRAARPRVHRRRAACSGRRPGALQAASRTLLVHQAEGRVAPAPGLRALRALRQGDRLHRPGADRRGHGAHRARSGWASAR